MQADKALLIIDVQQDFCPNGALSVAEGDLIIPLINQLQPYFDCIIATKDWHPANHMSFAANHPGHQIGEVIKTTTTASQILWPIHCVQESTGSQFHPNLIRDRFSTIIYKGTDPEIDSYSAFFDNLHLKKTELDDYLQRKQIKSIYLAGLATDYCVKYSAIDAVQLGYETTVIIDACRGVNLHENDATLAIQEMKAAGVNIIAAKDLTHDR